MEFVKLAIGARFLFAPATCPREQVLRTSEDESFGIYEPLQELPLP